MIKVLIGSFCATIGFAALFNVKGVKLYYCAIAGVVGATTYETLMHFDINEIIALFVASVCVSLYSEFFARKLKAPVTIFMVCGLICLVPGALIYLTMLNIIQGETYLAIQNGLNTLSIAGILSLGVVVVSTTFKIFLNK